MTRMPWIVCALALSLISSTQARAYVLWGTDHEARAQQLATVLHETSASVDDVRSYQRGGIPVSPNPTLTIWGHGDADQFAEMSVDELVSLIVQWHDKNKALSVVEIVTCDARHNQAGDGLDGYAGKVAQQLKAKKLNITIKALPKAPSSTASSVLWANAANGTFCYVTSSSQADIAKTNTYFSQHQNVNYNEACKADNFRAPSPISSTLTANGGNFDILRRQLVVVSS
jgi:hypothetical protein